MHGRRVFSSLVLTLLIGLFAVHGSAAEVDLPPVIVSAVPDAAHGLLTIRGTNFGTIQARVTLNSTPLPVITSDWHRLDSVELVPFRAAIAAGCTGATVAWAPGHAPKAAPKPPPAGMTRRGRSPSRWGRLPSSSR